MEIPFSFQDPNKWEKTESGLYFPKGYNSKKSRPSWSLIASIITIFIAVGSALGFFLALLHEVGFMYFHNLPYELIRLSQTTIIEYVAIALLLSFLFALTFFMWLMVEDADISKRWRGVYSFLVWANILLSPIFLYLSLRGFISLWGNSAYISIFILLIQLGLLIPLSNSRVPFPTIFKKMKSNRFMITVIIWACALLCFLAGASGFIDADFQTTYLVPSTHSDSVVVRMYGDNIICSPVSDNSTLENSFFIINLNDPNLKLSSRTYPHPLNVKR